ncbi:MAG: arsenite methyltransferase [archaeon]
MESKKIKKIVKDKYSEIADSSLSCGCSCNSSCCGESQIKQISKSIGYSEEDLKTPGNLGLGCGNPIALGKIKSGDIVLDLGSGAGFDAFLASEKVGKKGKVIGLDMTELMINKAKENAKKGNYNNVEFILGDIEEIPLKDNSINVIISNCVINLSPNKDKVFKESYRVLKKGGKMFVSDIVLLQPLSNDQKKNKDLIAGCVGGALLKKDYLKRINKAGFIVNILSEDKDISKRQYQGIDLESLKIEAIK